MVRNNASGGFYMNHANSIETIYDEREKFIIIGLTGRTGSGCTTISKILETTKFSELNLREPMSTDFENNNERKYQLIYKYAQEHWHSFKRISMTDVIISFLLQIEFSQLKDVLDSVFVGDEELSKNIFNEIEKTLKNEYEELNQSLSVCLTTEGSLNRSNDEYFEKERVLLDKLQDIQTAFRKIFRKHNYTYQNIEEKNILDELQEVQEKLNNCEEIKLSSANNTISEIQDNIKSIYSQYKANNNIEKGTKTIRANAYTFFLQQIGNRIRNHGDVNKGNYTNKHMFALARRANDFIKAIRAINRKTDKPTLICLDAIRNPYEATYFQDRYAAFYLVSVSTDNEERIRRLGKNYDSDQIKALDETEYPKKLKGAKRFTNQDIGSCSQLADIYIYNPRENTEEKYFVTALIVKYITLIMHPGLVTPSHVERCMQIAYNAKLNSGCLSRQVGAVITDASYSIKAVGWNSVAEGQVPCNLRSINNYITNKDYNSFSKYEIEDSEFSETIKKKYFKLLNDSNLDGRLFSYCFKDEYGEIKRQKNQVHTRSLHAEENAFLQIVKYGGESIKGGNLFTSASSCVLCSKKAFQLGIKNIYYIDPYPDIAIPHILSFGKDKSKCPQCHLFYGAIGKAYTCLFTQRIPIKDELDCLLNDNTNN